MKLKDIKTDTCIVSKDADGIIHKTVRPNAHLDDKAIKESDEIGFDLAGGKKALILYDARPNFTLNNKGMEYLHKHLLSKRRIASAIVSDKPGIRLLGHYFDNSPAGSPPVKVFHAMRDAKAWLLSFKNGKGKAIEKRLSVVLKHKPAKVKNLPHVKYSEPVHGSLTTCIARVEVDNNNVAHKRILPDAHVDMPSLAKSFKETSRFLGEEKRLMLYDLRPHFTITDDALEYVVDEIIGQHG